MFKCVLDQPCPNTLPLTFRRNGERAEAVPTGCAIGNGNRRNGKVPDQTAPIVGDKRYG